MGVVYSPDEINLDWEIKKDVVFALTRHKVVGFIENELRNIYIYIYIYIWHSKTQGFHGIEL